jgi:hypothetical protein
MGMDTMLMHCYMWTISALRIMMQSYAHDRLTRIFKMKPGSMHDPDFYLGAKLRMKRLSNGV